MSKKIIAFLLAMLLACLFCMPVAADQLGEEASSGSLAILLSLLLWMGVGLCLLLGLIVVIIVVKKKRK